MEYIKGDAYYALSNNKIKQYPYLNSNISCDTLIIGGGIDGLIANYYLSARYDTVLVDKGRLAYGCTSCATPLCEYQLDDFAHQIKGMTLEEVSQVYRMGLSSIDKLQQLVDKLGNQCHFERVPTLLYTKSKGNVADIEQEHQFRIDNGLDCQLWDSTTNKMPFDILRGLYCSDGGCTFNPYLLSKQLAENAKHSRIFENTKIDSIRYTGNGYIVYTNYHQCIECNKVVIATGYNWSLIDVELCDRFTTYTIVTEPIPELEWHEHTLCQDDQDPYHYMRVTEDNRILFGGEDTVWKDTISSAKADKMYHKLEDMLRTMLPQYSDTIKVQYRYCGAFASTANNVGVIGQSSTPHLYYFFSCGANGIVNAIEGVNILTDHIEGRHNEYAHLFTPQRRII